MEKDSWVGVGLSGPPCTVCGDCHHRGQVPQSQVCASWTCESGGHWRPGPAPSGQRDLQFGAAVALFDDKGSTRSLQKQWLRLNWGAGLLAEFSPRSWWPERPQLSSLTRELPSDLKAREGGCGLSCSHSEE